MEDNSNIKPLTDMILEFEICKGYMNIVKAQALKECLTDYKFSEVMDIPKLTAAFIRIADRTISEEHKGLRDKIVSMTLDNHHSFVTKLKELEDE